MGDVEAFVAKWCGGHDSGTLGPKIRADLAALLASERAAATAAAVGAICAKCPTCRGTGQRTTSCSMCGDSTFDHECNDREVPCERCAKIRALSPEGWVGVRWEDLEGVLRWLRFAGALPPMKAIDAAEVDKLDGGVIDRIRAALARRRRGDG